VIVQTASYALELVDALTGGPLFGHNAVTETNSGAVPYRVNASRWVFEGLPSGGVANFVITAHHYVSQTLTTGGALPNPQDGQPGFLAVITMMPRTGYPFSPSLTRVVGLVRLAPAVDPTSPVVPRAAVALTPVHQAAGTVSDAAVTVTTTDDGQYTFWFLPQLGEDPPIANRLTATATATVDGVIRTGSFPATDLIANEVTDAPHLLLS
jgi:hypothetical protein